MTERSQDCLVKFCAVKRVVEGWRARRLPESYKLIHPSKHFFNVKPCDEVKDGHSQVVRSIVARGGRITVTVIAPLNNVVQMTKF